MLAEHHETARAGLIGDVRAERKRIAGDLHDDLGAKLLTIVHTSDDQRISTLAREATRSDKARNAEASKDPASSAARSEKYCPARVPARPQSSRSPRAVRIAVDVSSRTSSSEPVRLPPTRMVAPLSVPVARAPVMTLMQCMQRTQLLLSISSAWVSLTLTLEMRAPVSTSLISLASSRCLKSSETSRVV